MTRPDGNVVQARRGSAPITPILVWHEHAEEYRAAVMRNLPGVPVEARRPSVRFTGESDARVLLAWQLPPGALGALPHLEWIQVSGAGVDHFLGRDDLPQGVLVTRSLGRFGIQAAEYTIGYLLHTLIGIDEYRRRQDRGRWEPQPRPLLCDRTVGVIGLGSLGSEIASRIAALGARVVGACRQTRPIRNVARVYAGEDWRSMLPTCDALVLAAPLTDETRGMLGADALAALPRGAVLVNVARGELVDEDALLEALRTRQLDRAVLDVFDSEPLPRDHPLWTEPRAWVTPHVAAPSEPDSIAAELAGNYHRYVRGEELRNLVDRERGY